MMKIAGVDEAGRGPWAGPVIAAAVILSEDATLLLQKNALRDSKKCSPKQRQKLFDILIHHKNIHYAIRGSSVSFIEQHNIRQATLHAMKRAVLALAIAPDCVLIDGKDTPDIPYPAHAIIRGDDTEPSIQAASILAKVMRDKMMCLLAQRYSAYHWQSNKGYGTIAHQEALRQHGATRHHRMTFKPLHNYVLNNGKRNITAKPPH